jgi:hypothetical protein
MGASPLTPWPAPVPARRPPPCRVDADASVHIGTRDSGLPAAPRVIWTYWAEARPPALVAACVLSWQTFHPDFDIRVVGPQHLGALFDPSELDMGSLAWRDGPARDADIVRVHLLHKYGGVWLDATFLAAAPLQFIDGVYAAQGPSFTGFYLQGMTTHTCWPVVENWAMAARPGCPFVAMWRQKFMETPNVVQGARAMVQAFRDSLALDVQGIPATLHVYLLMHLVAQFILQHTDHARLSMHVFPAEQGPFKYLAKGGWLSVAGVQRLLASFHPRRPMPMYTSYKLRGVERRAMSSCQQRLVLTRVVRALAS